MNKITSLLLVLITALSLMLITTMQSKADAGKGFTGIIPFVTNNDRLGFFNQNTGKIYVYDNNIKECLFVGQISELGSPIKTVNSNISTSNPATL